MKYMAWTAIHADDLKQAQGGNAGEEPADGFPRRRRRGTSRPCPMATVPKSVNCSRPMRPTDCRRRSRNIDRLRDTGRLDVSAIEGTANGTKLVLCIKGGLMVALTGENLTVLADYLEEFRTCKLYAFDPKKHRFKEGSDREKTPAIHDIKEDAPSLRKV